MSKWSPYWERTVRNSTKSLIEAAESGLDYPVPGVETEAELSQRADGRLFDDAMKSALQAKSADLPTTSIRS